MQIIRNGYSIREWQQNDYISLTQHANDITLWNHVRDYFPHPYTQKDAKEFIDCAASKKMPEEFALIADGKAVGGIGFIPGRDVERITAEIGYWIGKDYRNRGIVSDAVKVLSRYIFDTTSIVRIFTNIFEFNTASMRVMQKAGYTKLTVLKKAAIKNGKIIDLHYYELLKQ